MPTPTFPHFWSDHHDREYQRILRMRSLYEGKHCIVLYDREGGWKLPIYVTHNWLGDRLTRALTALVWRGFPYVVAAEKGRQGDLTRILRDTAMRALTANTQDAVSYAGYASLYLAWSSRLQQPILRRWGEHVGEFAWWELEGHTPWAVTFYKEEMLPSWQGRQNVRVKVGERFELDPPNRRVIVRNAAYVVTGVVSALGSYSDPWNLRAEYNPAQAAGTVNLDEPVPLSALYDAPPAEEAEMAMTVLPGCPVENVGEGLGVSDYTESLISLQKSMARLATQRDIAIVINEMPAMNVPAHCLNPDGTLDLGKIWVTMTDPGADPKDQIPINFNNWTGNLNESARQWELNDAAFYALSGLSPAIDGKADGSAGESGYARMLGMVKPSSAIEMRRLHWEPVFDWLTRAVPQLAALQGQANYGAPLEGVTLRWPSAIPEDPDALTNRLQAGLGRWISRKTAISLTHEEWTPAQVEEEERQIDVEAGG